MFENRYFKVKSVHFDAKSGKLVTELSPSKFYEFFDPETGVLDSARKSMFRNRESSFRSRIDRARL